MALVNDVLESPAVFYSRNRIFKEQLKEIIKDLDTEDIISIVFLFTHTKTNVVQLIQILDHDPCAVFLKLNNEKNWEEKLLEILIITGNIDIIRKLGYTKEEIRAMKINFSYNLHNVSPHLNRIIKSLYFLCKELGIKETKILIDKVNEQLQVAVDKKNACLELYILHWLQQNYFTIDEKNPKMDNLIQTLKVTGFLDNLPIDINFDYWKTVISENSLSRSDFFKQQNNQQSDNLNLLQLENSLSIQSSENLKCFWNENHEKLCIIVNEHKFFIGKFKDKPRKGSEQDVKNLKETFENCGFDIELYENLTEFEMMLLLESLSDPEYQKYGCIFICILSHGYEGAIIFSDDNIIKIKTIEEKFCCKNLRNSFKCIILQACQGQKPGVIDVTDTDSSSELVTDGLFDNPMFHDNFILFQATINEFMAWRDENKGTWFIQVACDVIKELSPIEISKWIQIVTKRVKNLRGKTNDINKKVIQLPRVIQSKTSDYILVYKKKLIEHNKEI